MGSFRELKKSLMDGVQRMLGYATFDKIIQESQLPETEGSLRVTLDISLVSTQMTPLNPTSLDN